MEVETLHGVDVEFRLLCNRVGGGLSLLLEFREVRKYRLRMLEYWDGPKRLFHTTSTICVCFLLPVLKHGPRSLTLAQV